MSGGEGARGHQRIGGEQNVTWRATARNERVGVNAPARKRSLEVAHVIDVDDQPGFVALAHALNFRPVDFVVVVVLRTLPPGRVCMHVSPHLLG